MNPTQQHALSQIYDVLPDGRWHIKLDNLRINDLSICEQLFKYRHVDCQHLKGGKSWYATFGIWWAHVLEDIYEDTRKRQENELPPPDKGSFISAAVRWWLKDDMDAFALVAPKQYQKFAQGYVGVRISGRELRMPMGAVNMAAQYFDFYNSLHDFENWRIIATESTFGLRGELVIGENDKVVVAYQGRPDIVSYDVGKGILEPADNKTTAAVDGKWEDGWRTNPQLKGYLVAVQELAKQVDLKLSEPVNTVLINGTARDEPPMKPKDGIRKPRFKRIRVEFSQPILEEWKRKTLAKATRLRYCIENDEWLWKESVCNYQYGHPCEYRIIDELPEQERAALFKSHYVTLEPWTPETVGERKTV